jgi:hypothetical protein
MRHAYLLSFVLVCSCSEPKVVSADEMDGTYTNPNCPSFRIENGNIAITGDTIEGQLFSERGFLVLETKRSLRYLFRDGECIFVVSEMGALNYFDVEAGVATVKLSSKDRMKAMTWVRQRRSK